MSEQEAVTYLNLTARTLRNYRKRGKLAYREVPGRTRPVIEYEQSDLDRLRAELERRRKRGKKPEPVKPPLPRVTFGLTQSEYEALRAEADKYGMTPGEYARRLARDGMEARFREDAELLRTELGKANVEIKLIRKEFAAAFEVILEQVGLSPEDARKWVTSNLR